MESYDQLCSCEKENSIERIRNWIQTFNGSGKLALEKDNETGIATICLMNPSKKNALDGPMMAQLSYVVDELENWREGRAIIIYGYDRFFCSGMDLQMAKCLKDDIEKSKLMATLMRDTLKRLKELPMLSVAFIEGKALGGGAELTTACDFRIVAPNAEIGFVHIKMGITSAFGAGARLVQLLGYSKVLEIITSARLINSVEAIEIGFANYMVKRSAENYLNEVKEW
ncbi:ethylmalonyl-CoA decarboxylase-like protein, partial [Dinothrombium tinctorium]